MQSVITIFQKTILNKIKKSQKQSCDNRTLILTGLLYKCLFRYLQFTFENEM